MAAESIQEMAKEFAGEIAVPTPSPMVTGLRTLRSWAYRAVSPVEAWQRRRHGEDPLPPLWLRRHTGAPNSFRSAARGTAELIDGLELLSPQYHVLDIGCGCGAMAFELGERLSAEGRYIGFDVHGPCVGWCRRAFADDPRFAFELARIESPYSEGAKASPLGAYSFPADDGTIDLVLAKSVFTHMTRDDLAHYLDEIARVLSPRGAALVTFFLFDGAENPRPAAFPYPEGPRTVMRWRRRRHPHAALAYERSFAESLIAKAGLEPAAFIPGFWPGASPEITGQDQLVLRKRD